MSELERRLRRIVQLVALLGIAGGIVGMFPAHFTDPSTYLLVTRPAYGIPMVLLVGATLLCGGFVYHTPRRGVVIGWVIWTGLAVFTWFGITWEDHWLSNANLWPEAVGEILIGAMLVTIFPIAVIVAFASKSAPPDDSPSARLIER